MTEVPEIDTKADPRAAVLDATALLALGAGNQSLSRMVFAAHHDPERHLFTPALCLAAATAERPALAEHLGGLSAIEILDLGFVGASAVGKLIAQGEGWQLAHAMASAEESLEWPEGLPVVTADSGPYEARGHQIIPVHSERRGEE